MSSRVGWRLRSSVDPRPIRVLVQLLTLLLEQPTDDSVEVAVGFVKECGQMLTELTPSGMHAVFERFRGILHDGAIDKRVQYTIEALFAVRKVKFADYPAVIPELDLVEREDQITHEVRPWITWRACALHSCSHPTTAALAAPGEPRRRDS